jgi:hypothetical protein
MSVHASAVVAPIDQAQPAAGSSVNHADLIEHLRSLAVKFLSQRLQSFQEEAEGLLFDLAAATQDEDLHSLYLDTISRLRNKRDLIKREASERFIRLIKSPEARTISFTTTSAKIDNLLLDGDDDLESSLAVKNLISQACERHSDRLEAIEEIHLRICDKNLPNPLSPTLYCVAWKETVDLLKAQLDTKVIIYKLFSKFVLNHLGTVYDRALSELSMQGISPRVRRNPAAEPAPENVANRSGGAGSQKASDLDPEALTRELVIKRSLEILKSESPRQSADSRERAILDALTLLQGYVDVLQPANSKTRPGREATDMIHLFSRLAQIAHGESFRKRDREILNAVRGMFDPMLDDDRLDPRVRALAARLQVPALKTAFLDASVLERADHPLRVLLSNIGAIAQADDRPNSDFSSARYAVTRVLSELRQDVCVLDQIVGARKPQAGSPTSVPRADPATADTPRGQIEKYVKGRRVPEIVRSFLDGAWTEVLTTLIETDGPTGESVRNALTAVDELVSVLQPHEHAAHHDKVMETIPRLLCKLQNGLATISFDRGLKDQVFNQLIGAHAKSIHFKKANIKPGPLKTK